MSRRIFVAQSNWASTAKGAWAAVDGQWLPVKAAWAKTGAAWTQIWPSNQDLTFTISSSSAEVYYSSLTFSWATTQPTVPGTVAIQRKLVGGEWTSIYTSSSLSGNTAIANVVPAGSTAGTVKFRLAFTPTNATDCISYSEELQVAASYRNQGAAPAVYLDTSHGYGDPDDDFDVDPISWTDGVAKIAFVGGTMQRSEMTALSVSVTGANGWACGAWDNPPLRRQLQQQLPSNVFTFSVNPSNLTHSSNSTWMSIIGIGWSVHLGSVPSYSFVWGIGLNQVGHNGVTVTATFRDGQTRVFSTNDGNGMWVGLY